MKRHTPHQQILTDTRLTLAELSRLSGVSLHTLRSMSAGRNAKPQKQTRRKLAAALRQHSQVLSTLADTLDAP